MVVIQLSLPVLPNIIMVSNHHYDHPRIIRHTPAVATVRIPFPSSPNSILVTPSRLPPPPPRLSHDDDIASTSTTIASPTASSSTLVAPSNVFHNDHQKHHKKRKKQHNPYQHNNPKQPPTRRKVVRVVVVIVGGERWRIWAPQYEATTTTTTTTTNHDDVTSSIITITTLPTSRLALDGTSPYIFMLKYTSSSSSASSRHHRHHHHRSSSSSTINNSSNKNGSLNLIIERTIPSFQFCSHIRNQTHILGPLHRDRIPYVQNIYNISMSSEGSYLLQGGFCDPHYILCPEELPKWEQQLDNVMLEQQQQQKQHHHSRYIAYKYIGANESSLHVGPQKDEHSEFITIVNHNTIEYEQLNLPSIMDEIPWDRLIHRIYHDIYTNKLPKDPLRNYHRYSFGITTGLCLVEDQDGILQPFIRPITDELIRTVFKVMNTIGNTLWGERIGQLFYDPIRTNQFAAKLDPTNTFQNTIEAITIAISFVGKDKNLHCHVDNENDAYTKNYGIVVGSWKFATINENEKIRIVILGYSRKSVSEYYCRRTKQLHFYQSYIIPWYDQLSFQQMSIQVDHLCPDEDYPLYHSKNDLGDMIYPEPHVDISLFCSAFVDAILSCYQTTSRKDGQEKSISYHHWLVLCICCGLSPSAEPFRHVLLTVWGGRIPATCVDDCPIRLGMRYCAAAQQTFPYGCSYPRYNPQYFTWNRDHDWWIKALNAIIKAFDSAMTNVTPQVVCTMMKKRIPNLSALALKQIIHVAALLRIIPTRYACEIIIEGEDLIQSGLIHCAGIQDKQRTSLIKFVARKLITTWNIAERICLDSVMEQQYLDTSCYYDVVYHDQEVIVYPGEIKGSSQRQQKILKPGEDDHHLYKIMTMKKSSDHGTIHEHEQSGRF